MDYKALEHSNDFKCPECEGSKYINKEYDTDDYGNDIFIFECECGYKYWFHKSGNKIGNTLAGLQYYCDVARSVIASKSVPLKERYEKTHKALKSYFYCDFKNKGEASLAVGLITELQYRIAYDMELLMALYDSKNIGNETIAVEE